MVRAIHISVAGYPCLDELHESEKVDCSLFANK